MVVREMRQQEIGHRPEMCGNSKVVRERERERERERALYSKCDTLSYSQTC